MAEKILVVDDETDLELVMRQRFRKQIKEGLYEFVFAYNGLEALAKLVEHPDVSIILSDINMPEMDGLTLLTKLNELRMPTLKTVVVSAYGDMDNIRTAMNRGAFDFVTKPVDFADLEITIQKAQDQLEILRAAIADREQLVSIQHDLDVARDIQQAILPKKEHPYPHIPEFDIFGLMTAAKQVGGDFFDYFLIDNDRLGFVIGDVSGKGIPAAIFMAVSRTLIRATGLKGEPTNECMNYTNRLLCNESLDSMFVTVFYGILNFKTGEIQYTNAGHNPPLVLKANGTVEVLAVTNNIVMGAFEEFVYKPDTAKMEHGDTLLLYTDGITEALNPAVEDYGFEHLQKQVQPMMQLDMKALVKAVEQDVHTFAAGVEQSDDITVLAVKYN